MARSLLLATCVLLSLAPPNALPFAGAAVPTLTKPFASTTYGSTLPVEFTLPASAVVDSVQLVLTRTSGALDASVHTVIFTTPFESAGTHMTHLSTSNLANDGTGGVNANIKTVSNPSLVYGAVYSAALSFRDAASPGTVETNTNVAVQASVSPGPALVTLSEPAVSVAEGAATTYDVVLRSVPTADVKVTCTLAGGTADVVKFTGSASATKELTFTPANWNTPQVRGAGNMGIRGGGGGGVARVCAEGRGGRTVQRSASCSVSRALFHVHTT
jgi:hypothetical protein